MINRHRETGPRAQITPGAALSLPGAELEPLQPLDLRRCTGIASILDAYSRCSFGARMLGEVYSTLSDWFARQAPPSAIYDGPKNSPVAALLQEMAQERVFDRVLTPDEYASEGSNPCVVIVGRFSERHDDMLLGKPDHAIFVNSQSIADPRKLRDGHFPDAVFGPPALVLSLLRAGIQERFYESHRSVSEVIEGLEKHGGIAASVARGRQVLQAMIERDDCTRFMTLSGAMTIAQMSLVIADMIDLGMVHAVTSTGALMAHGLMPGLGLKHYKHRPGTSDADLARFRLNRVTDTYEPESNLDQAADVLDAVLSNYQDGQVISPSQLHRDMGAYLKRHHPNERAILSSAFDRDVPIFVPAFVDSELGNDTLTHNWKRDRLGRGRLIVNPELDSERLVKLAASRESMGIFSVGGGVPRNNVQNVAPLIEIINSRIPNAGLPPRLFSFGVRIAPDEMHLGHLTGCTYDEGTSWRKFATEARTAEIKADATIVWPLLVKCAMDSRVS